MSSRTQALLFVVLGLSGIACDIENRHHKVERGERDGGGRMLDGAVLDGSIVLPDGRVIGGGRGDSSVTGDGGPIVLPDGRVIGGDGGGFGDGGSGGPDGGGDRDSGPPEIDVTACSVGEAEGFEIAVPFVEGGFGIAPGQTDFGLAHFRKGSCKHALDSGLVSSSSGEVTTHTLLDGCDTMREVALTNTSDGWHVIWTDNSTKTIELHAMTLDQELALPEGSQPSAVTTSAQFERNPAAASILDTPIAAWVGEENDERSIMTQPLVAGASPQVVVDADSDHLPIDLALSPIGLNAAALGWVEEIADRGIWLQPLDMNAMPSAAPIRLTTFAAPGSSIALASRDSDGGAAIYSVGIDNAGFEVRFHRLSGQATLRGTEIKIISAPLQGKDAGVAHLGGGYVVAYRAIPDGRVIKQPEVRLVFVSKEGNLSRDEAGRLNTFLVTPAARDGSPIQVALSVDGQLLIAFVDGNDAGENTLRVIRRRLDCPL